MPWPCLTLSGVSMKLPPNPTQKYASGSARLHSDSALIASETPTPSPLAYACFASGDNDEAADDMVHVESVAPSLHIWAHEGGSGAGVSGARQGRGKVIYKPQVCATWGTQSQLELA